MYGMMGFPFGLPEEGNESERKTWPPAGSADLTIDEEMDALFFSATWTIRARVAGEVIWESKPRVHAQGDALMRQWARFIIRRFYDRLRELGVDADAEYLKFGGKADDLK